MNYHAPMGDDKDDAAWGRFGTDGAWWRVLIVSVHLGIFRFAYMQSRPFVRAELHCSACVRRPSLVRCLSSISS